MIADHWARWPFRSRLLIENEDQRAYIRRQNSVVERYARALQDITEMHAVSSVQLPDQALGMARSRARRALTRGGS